MRRLTRYAVSAFDALVVGLFLLGYAAAYVPPAFSWWMELIAVGLPYAALWIVLATAGYALAGDLRRALGHGVLVLLVVLRFLPAGWPTPGTPAPEDLILLTVNAPPIGDERVQARRLRELAQRYDPDLVALQETRARYRIREGFPLSSSAFSIAALVDTLDYEPAVLDPEVRRSRTRSLNVSQPVLSRAVPVEMTYHLLDSGDPEGRQTYVTRAVFSWQGREAVLFNVHLRSYGANKPWEDDAEAAVQDTTTAVGRYLPQYREAIGLRGREAEQLRTMIEGETQPVLVMGDLNSTMHSWAYRHLKAAGLQDAFLQTGREWGGTFHARFPLVRIDFVLAGPEWEVVTATVPDATFSDHRPLVVRLRWRDRATAPTTD